MSPERQPLYPVRRSSHSSACQHPLLPSRSTSVFIHPGEIDEVQASWAFASGTAIVSIWPQIVWHLLAALALTVCHEVFELRLQAPDSLMICASLVTGFGISYRAQNGYDRFMQARTQWSTVIKTSRTLSRLVCLQVPERLTPIDVEDTLTIDYSICREEKEHFLDLVLAFAVSLKHSLRGEHSIYYDDLYRLVSWPPQQQQVQVMPRPSLSTRKESTSASTTHPPCPSDTLVGQHDDEQTASAASVQPRPLPASGESYGTFDGAQLLPSVKPKEGRATIATSLRRYTGFGGVFRHSDKGVGRQDEFLHRPLSTSASKPHLGADGKWQPLRIDVEIPLSILADMTTYLNVLERRGNVSGSALGQMFSCVTAFEDALTVCEQIITTPLPVIYSVHLRMTVYIYLLALPIQVVAKCGWYTPVVVAFVSFLFLGFLAAGEELSQPFGYEPNDVDLDDFCHRFIEKDLDRLRQRPKADWESKWWTAETMPQAEEEVVR